MSDDPMVEEFFGELNDKYYPQILEGLELLDSAEVEKGIETLARPLHTIKGVTGFMPGFEEGSTYTHRVEDYLKKLQAGDLTPDEDHTLLASRAVNMVFAVLEQLREYGEVRSTEPGEVLALVNALLEEGPAEAEAPTEAVDASQRDGVLVLTVRVRRMHLHPQREALAQSLAQAEPGVPVLVDLSGVETMNSSAWTELAALATDHPVTAAALSPACKASFHLWGFDQTIAVAADLEEFFRSREVKQ